MEWWQIYLITQCSVFSDIFFAISIISGILMLLWIGFRLHSIGADEEVSCRLAGTFLRFSPFVFVLSLLLFGLTPKTPDAVAIYLVPKIVNNEEIRDVSDKMWQLLQMKLDEWIEKNKVR